MLNFMVLAAAIITADVLICSVEGLQLRDADTERLLQELQELAGQSQQIVKNKQASPSFKKSHKKTYDQTDKEETLLSWPANLVRKKRKEERVDDSINQQQRINQNALERLFSNDKFRSLYNEHRKRKVRKPKALASELASRDNVDSLDKHPKVIVILNSQKRQIDSDGLTKIITNLLSKGADSPQKKRRRPHKGFLLDLLGDKKYSRRRIPRKMENSVEDIRPKKKIKRSRSDYAKAGGRTPIPYIRQRGDIYERDE